jgi:hypothetical protein
MIQILRGITNGFTELDSLLIWIITSNHTVIVNGILRVSLLNTTDTFCGGRITALSGRYTLTVEDRLQLVVQLH